MKGKNREIDNYLTQILVYHGFSHDDLIILKDSASKSKNAKAVRKNDKKSNADEKIVKLLSDIRFTSYN